MKQATCCKGCKYEFWSAVYGCYFDGTIFRRRYLEPDIKNAFLNVQTARQAILYWYGLNRLTHLEDDNLAAWSI